MKGVESEGRVTVIDLIETVALEAKTRKEGRLLAVQPWREGCCRWRRQAGQSPEVTVLFSVPRTATNKR